MARTPSTDQRQAPAASSPGPLLARLNARGFRLLMPVDAVAVAAALVLPMLVRHGLTWPSYSVWTYALGYGLVVVLHLLTLYFGGLYDRQHRLGTRPVLPRVVAGTVGAILLVALLELLSEIYLVPRANLPFVLALASLGVTGNRVASRHLERKRSGPPRVFLVGDPADVELARAQLADAPERSQVVGAASTPDDLLDGVVATRATDVLLLSGNALDDIYPEPLSALDRGGVGVLQRVTARDTLLGLQTVREVAGMPCVSLQTQTLPRSRARAKRTMEMTLLVAGAPVLIPLTGLLAAYVAVTAGRPVLYRQRRVGLEGRVFELAKLRTMVRDAEHQGEAVLSSREDPRIIPACRWLRATRLDELPQLWNVVRGEMSLVGPRPERPELTEHFEKLIPGYARRHEIPPGLTGLAQVHGRYHTDPAYKLGHDLQYLVNWSPVLDLQILARTVWVVLSRQI